MKDGYKDIVMRYGTILSSAGGDAAHFQIPPSMIISSNTRVGMCLWARIGTKTSVLG